MTQVLTLTEFLELRGCSNLFKEYPDILTIRQVAQALGIGTKAAYALVNDKKLGAIRVGRTIKVPKFSLEEFVKTARNNVML